MRFDNSSHRRLPPSRGKLPIKNNCRLRLPVLGINILSLNFVFVNLSRYVRKALFSLLKGARGSFYRLRFRALFGQPPRFSSNENRSPFLFFTCGHFGEPEFTPQAARCSASCKIPVSEHRETGICSCLLQSSPCKIFLCFAKAFGQPLKTTHRVVFLTLSFKSLLLSIEKQNGQASLLVRYIHRRNRDL